MKIFISYPPLDSAKGTPLLSQNRQFQYFRSKTVIFPVVPAQAAALLKKSGHDVVWNDSIAQGASYDQFVEFIARESPDLLVFETKTPVIQQHWRIINDIRKKSRSVIFPLIALVGDHVTALPEESMQNSLVDFVITGGDFDFLLKNLCDCIQVDNLSFKLNTEELEPGIWYRDNGVIRNSGAFQLNHDLNSLPFIDRDLVQWELYAYNNGNYKRTPGTYIMSGRDCWWHKCTFCSWPTLYPQFRSRTATNVLDEVGELINRYNVKEIMDDTGTFPVGDWLMEFCHGAISRGYNKKVFFDCNMRFGALTKDDYSLMKKTNFRLLLFGLESANQKTLDRINKDVTVEEIIRSCRLARESGFFPHITIMFGYPWETYEEALNTLKLGKWLLEKGYAYTMQATVVIPYPGSLLFEECKRNDWLKTLDWSRYDMREAVMKLSFDEGKVLSLAKSMYQVAFSPEFIIRKLFSVRDLDDLRYYGRAAQKTIGHMFDFSARRN